MIGLKKIWLTVIVFTIPLICFSQSNVVPEEVLKAEKEFLNGIHASEEAQLKQLEAANPKLAKMHRRWLAIRDEIRGISQSFNEGRINEVKASEQLRPLLKEQISIEKDEDYQLENRLNILLYRAKATQ